MVEPALTCVSCDGRTSDASRDGWHVFDDGLGEEHAICPTCAERPSPAGTSRSPVEARSRAAAGAS